MRIAANQLQAFYATCQKMSFTRAAEDLGITQSALSQRIALLESDLEVTLLIRDTAGLKLTDAGESLLRYCQINSTLEDEVLQRMKTSNLELRGTLRIAAYSSILESVIIPALAPFLRKHPQVFCQFSSYEMPELYEVLRSAQADLVVLDHSLMKNGIVEHKLGQEEFVIIESTKYEARSDLYLDHGSADNATESFFKHQAGVNKKYQRNYMGDVFGILKGVELGLGRAVMSKHLLATAKGVRQLQGYKRYFRDIHLHYFEQAYYSRLQQQVVKELLERATVLLTD